MVMLNEHNSLSMIKKTVDFQVILITYSRRNQDTFRSAIDQYSELVPTLDHRRSEKE